MKKTTTLIFLASASAVAVYFLLRSFLGFSPWRIGDAISVATHMGAKLGCSAYFISGLSEQQIIEDLASYSPVNRKLSIHYDKINRRASVNLFGLGEARAEYREALGCTLKVGETSTLNQIKVDTDMSLTTATRPWPLGNQVNTINIQTQNLTDKLLADDNRHGLDTRALLVVQGGRITAESYAEGIGIHTPLMGWSMAKSLTAVMLGRMEYLGLADMNRTSLFPQWQQDERATISLENLLHMSSGLKFDETYAPGSDATDMLFGAFSASDIVLGKTLAHKPGTHFSYSSGTSNALMRWIHDSLGGTESTINFLYRELFIPLGMSHTAVEPDPSGVLMGSSYMYASARDWAKLGLLMLNRGKLNDRQLLSEAWVDRATQANNSKNKQNYGYHFWLNHQAHGKRWARLPSDAFFMSGNRKQYVMIAPSENTIIVRLGWTKSRYPLEENFSTILTQKKALE